MILKPISYESLIMSPFWNIYLSIHYPLHPLLLSNLRSIPLTPFQIYFPPILLLLHPCRYIIVGPNLRLLTRNLQPHILLLTMGLSHLLQMCRILLKLEGTPCAPEFLHPVLALFVLIIFLHRISPSLQQFILRQNHNPIRRPLLIHTGDQPLPKNLQLYRKLTHGTLFLFPPGNKLSVANGFLRSRPNLMVLLIVTRITWLQKATHKNMG